MLERGGWAAESLTRSPNDEVGAAAKAREAPRDRTPLRCALGCAGAGAALAGPRTERVWGWLSRRTSRTRLAGPPARCSEGVANV